VSTRTTAVLPKSFLYVPANKPALFAKALAGDAEALILDLEDAVPLADKAAARTAVADWLGQETRPTAWVRVGADALADDVAALSGASYGGVMLAKADERSVRELDALLPAGVPVIGLVETAAALQQLPSLAAVPRVVTFGIGEVDLLADLRLTAGPATAGTVDALRLQVVVACAAAGLAAPVAPTSTDFRDLEAFAASTAHLVALGFRSRTAIHPGQCALINRALTPADDDVAAATDVVERFDRAESGVAVDARGALIDAAVVRGARETLSRAGRPSSLPTP
jgi:citrate lyase subunit beta/citryl-CoA lyase